MEDRAPTAVDEQVMWAACACWTNPDADDEELIEIMRAAGVPDASRALTFTVIAYGDHVLSYSMTLPGRYHLHEPPGSAIRELALADEPLYVAGRAHARTVDRDELQAVAGRSAAMHAAGEALEGGVELAELADAAWSPPQVLITPAAASPPLPSAQARLDALVRERGASVPLEARVFAKELMRGHVVLVLVVGIPLAGRLIMEHYAGRGATIGEALDLAFERFTRGSLPVFLAVLGGREHGNDLVTWRRVGAFELCAGPVLRQRIGDPPPDAEALVEALYARLATASLSAEVHWFRFFIGVERGEVRGLDSLIDNEHWAPGSELAETWTWPHADELYSLRLFCALVPATPSAPARPRWRRWLPW